MNVPESGGTVSIHNLGESSGLSVKRVSLLGYPGDLLGQGENPVCRITEKVCTFG